MLQQGDGRVRGRQRREARGGAADPGGGARGAPSQRHLQSRQNPRLRQQSARGRT